MFSVLPYIRFLSLVELKHWLAEVVVFPLSILMESILVLKMLPGYKGLGSRLIEMKASIISLCYGNKFSYSILPLATSRALPRCHHFVD